MPLTALTLIGLYRLAGAASRLGVLLALCYALVLIDLPDWLTRRWELGDLISLILAGLAGGRLARYVIWRALHTLLHEPFAGALRKRAAGVRAAGVRAAGVGTDGVRPAGVGTDEAWRKRLAAWLAAEEPLRLDWLVAPESARR